MVDPHWICIFWCSFISSWIMQSTIPWNIYMQGLIGLLQNCNKAHGCMSSCGQVREASLELQSRFSWRPIRQALMLSPALPSALVQISLLLYMQAASNFSTHSKILLYWTHHILVCSWICDQNSFAELRAFIWPICTAWFCCVYSCNCTLAACWAVNSCMTDLLRHNNFDKLVWLTSIAS